MTPFQYEEEEDDVLTDIQRSILNSAQVIADINSADKPEEPIDVVWEDDDYEDLDDDDDFSGGGAETDEPCHVLLMEYRFYGKDGQKDAEKFAEIEMNEGLEFNGFEVDVENLGIVTGEVYDAPERQKYIFLEDGDIIEVGDEVFVTHPSPAWLVISAGSAGFPKIGILPIRRKVV